MTTTKTKSRRPQPNFKLLRRVRDAILAHPDQFVIDKVFSRRLEVPCPVGGCGTAACIAGWTLRLSGKHRTLSAARKALRTIRARASRGSGPDELDLAAKLLRIPPKPPFDRDWGSFPHPLFFLDCWPGRFQTAWCETKTPQEQAAVAAARIDDFIRLHGGKP